MKYPSRQDGGNIWTSDDLDLAQHEGFTFVPEQFSILDSSKNRPSRHYLYTHLGYGIELRYSQIREEWAAHCPHFGIKTRFIHQSPRSIGLILRVWLLDYIENVICPLPAIFDLARKHNCTIDEAQVIFDDRASR